METTDRSKIALSLSLLLFSACAAQPEPGPPLAEAEADVGFHIPVDFRPECAYLKTLPEAPPDLTVRDFFACLTDDSRAQLDGLYRHRAARRPGAPADLDALVAAQGGAMLANAHLRDLAFGAGARERYARNVRLDGVESKLDADSSTTFGIDPTTCSSSCLSKAVGVVGATRIMGYRSSSTGPVKEGAGRQLDQIMPGTFPNHDQHTLANPELVASGCGPTSEVNLLEWWNIPVFHNGVHLTTFDDRANFIADQMDTLDGPNFTDDDDLFDFVSTFPKQMYENGHTSGYPGSHWMRGDSEAWKVMLSYIARGFPVIALYATGTESLHWAMIAGYQNGNLLIANAGDRTLADFYAQWDSWDSLAWYATAASELFVDEDTFIAYTGWGDSSPEPDRFAARRTGVANPGYTASGTTYRFRYCVGGNDDMGDAEASPVADWTDEPDGALPGYCMFENGEPSFTYAASPSGGAAASKRNAPLSLSITPGSGFDALASANPGVRCEFWGLASTGWTQLATARCSAASSLTHTFTNNGQYSKVAFLVHSADFSETTWTISTR